jgi:HPt (histidine-containing phosphotransfer) domain-containing protein
MMLRKWQNSINGSKPNQNSNELKLDKSEEYLAHFDKNALLEKVGGDFKAVEQMMEIAWKYFKEVPKLLEATKTQPEELHNHAHKLKGTALNMEFSILARLALKLMHEIDQKAPYNDLIKDIHDEITLIKQIIDQ